MKYQKAYKEGDLRIWWIPQIGCGAQFNVDVESPEEAKKLLTVLASYDMFQLEHRIKPDFCNAGGLCVYESDGDGGFDWCDWYDENGYDVDGR